MENSKSKGNKEKRPLTTKNVVDKQTVVTIVDTSVEREIQNVFITSESEHNQPCCSSGVPGQHPTQGLAKQDPNKHPDLGLFTDDSTSSVSISIDVNCHPFKQDLAQVHKKITNSKEPTSCEVNLLSVDGKQSKSSLTNLFNDIEVITHQIPPFLPVTHQPQTQPPPDTNQPQIQSSPVTNQSQTQTPPIANQPQTHFTTVMNQPQAQSPTVTNQPLVHSPQVRDHPQTQPPQVMNQPGVQSPLVTNNPYAHSRPLVGLSQPLALSRQVANNPPSQLSPVTNQSRAKSRSGSNQRTQSPPPPSANPEAPPTSSRGMNVVNIPNDSINRSLQRGDTMVNVPNNTTTCAPQRTDQVLGPPPSYSKSLLDRRVTTCASIQFVAPIPPPSYDGMENELRYAHTLGHTGGFTLGLGTMWQGQPQPAYCPICETVIITQVDVRVSRIAHIVAMVMFLFLCWPFCLLPYFLNVCNYTFHYCSVCHSYLGARRPFQRG